MQSLECSHIVGPPLLLAPDGFYLHHLLEDKTRGEKKLEETHLSAFAFLHGEIQESLDSMFTPCSSQMFYVTHQLYVQGPLNGSFQISQSSLSMQKIQRFPSEFTERS